MWRKRNSERREVARDGLRHRRARRRARRRLTREGAGAGPLRRIGWSLTEFAWAVQERLAWPVADAAREVGSTVEWLLEQLVWAAKERLVWPLGDALAGGEGRSSGIRSWAAVAAVCVLGVAAATAGALTAKPGHAPETATAEAGTESLAQDGSLTEATRPQIAQRTEEKPTGPALRGARPSFGSSSAEEIAEARRLLRAEGDDTNFDDAADSGVSGGPGDGTSPAERFDAPSPGHDGTEGSDGDGGTQGGSLGSGADGVDGVDGDELTLMEQAELVARRFAGAFVAYEIGAESDGTREAIRETASRPLARSLEDRPPRLPADGRVPRARVVNVVDGPREGRKLTMSVSLLRVNGLAELRLELQRNRQGWRVSAVKG